MSIAYFKKIPNGFVLDESANDPNVLKSIKVGEVIRGEFKQPRNYIRHKKFFALLNIAFDAFDPVATYKGQVIEKNFNRFRKDITILAGHHETVVNINGEPRLEAKSISFASMSQDDFDAFYNTVVNVILQKVLSNYTKDDLDQLVEQVVRF